jgi:hypothetical protein
MNGKYFSMGGFMMCAVHHVPYRKVLGRMRGKTIALICGGVPVSNSRYLYYGKTEKQLH